MLRIACTASRPVRPSSVKARRERATKQIKQRFQERAKHLKEIVTKLDNIARSEELYLCEMFECLEEEASEDQNNFE